MSPRLPFRTPGTSGPGSPEVADTSEPPLLFHNQKNKAVYVSNDDGDGNWLISYADLMTLLFGFFVMISSFSKPNADQVEKLKRATSESLGGKYVRPFEDVSQKVTEILAQISLDRDVNVRETEDGVRLSVKGTLFFDAGSAVLRPEATDLLNRLSDIIQAKAKGFRIVVEGHTDDTPISTAAFPSNWELSSARAGSVVRLFESKGIDGRLLRPLGLADKDPLYPNRDADGKPLPANQAENRRIVIRIQRDLQPARGAEGP